MRMKLRIALATILSLLVASCGGSESDSSQTNGTPADNDSQVTVTTQRKAVLNLSIQTDKACYRPGETITFTANGNMPNGVTVRYLKAGNVVETETVRGSTWTWTAPLSDFTGYLAEVITTEGNVENILGTVGIDVSSDWTRFPRYGFVATFDDSKTDAVIKEEMAFLNRCHINGIQFYDWHYKHHWPLGGTRGGLLDNYTDIANRNIKLFISVFTRVATWVE